MVTAETDPEAPPSDPRFGLRWWREVVLVLGFYLVYSWVRNRFGSAAVDPDVALTNALRVIDLEKAMGLYVEADIQGWFLDSGWFLRIWNIFYGTFHFVVTGAAMVLLYLKYPADYPRFRTIGLATTGLALVGFALFPLMPPRLLGECGPFGGCVDSTYVDSLAVHGGWWSFSDGPMEAVSNQYAAMPSLHFAWAFWSYLVLAPRVRSTAAKVAITLYPWITVFAIVVTANHYWIDALAGGLVLAGGYAIGTPIANWAESRRSAAPNPSGP